MNHRSFTKGTTHKHFKLKFFSLRGSQLSYLRRGTGSLFWFTQTAQRKVNLNRAIPPRVLSYDTLLMEVHIIDEAQEDE